LWFSLAISSRDDRQPFTNDCIFGILSKWSKTRKIANDNRLKRALMCAKKVIEGEKR